MTSVAKVDNRGATAPKKNHDSIKVPLPDTALVRKKNSLNTQNTRNLPSFLPLILAKCKSLLFTPKNFLIIMAYKFVFLSLFCPQLDKAQSKI